MFLYIKKVKAEPFPITESTLKLFGGLLKKILKKFKLHYYMIESFKDLCIFLR